MGVASLLAPDVQKGASAVQRKPLHLCGQHVQPDNLIYGLWVNNSCLKKNILGNLWLKSRWVKSLRVNNFWVKSLRVQSLGKILWVKNMWV